jgi:predicted metal-dependent hydrolase
MDLISRAGTPSLPTCIHLPALGETWMVAYRATTEPHVGAYERAGRLEVRGAVHEPARCREALRRWLKRRARSTLEPMIAALAHAHDLPEPRTLRVGLPRTRWASCSARETISVNARLLCLPGSLVRHVLLHELCHLEHLNHSRDFYARLAEIDPQHRAARRELRDARSHVPEWIDLDRRPASPRPRRRLHVLRHGQ